MNYKNTLNLPRTDFAMKANLAQREPGILELWQKGKLYSAIRAIHKTHEKFILHDGPPYANGFIHIGHALNKILKDIVIKYKTMRGYDAPFIIGWDCHGLPVEHQLFKELKRSKHDVDIIDFRKQAKEFALKFVELQKKDFERLGVFSDWDNPYLTLNHEYEYWVIKLLENLVDQGYIYRGLRPVNWCARCETALAEAEVDYHDKQSDSIYVLFDIKDQEKHPLFSLIQGPCAFLVWTTTPWTLISNVAVAVHPELEYVCVTIGKKKVVLAKELLPAISEKLSVSLKPLATFKGNQLEQTVLVHPFLERSSPVVGADFVSKEEGSGCVHIAPGHGEEDYSLVKKYHLKVIMPVNDKGIFTEEAGPFSGLSICAATEKVIEVLNDKQRLLHHEKIAHSYPHCWRCKEAIIFRATYQWFLNVDHRHLRAKTLQEVDKVRWIPASGAERMRAMLTNRPDWCLSRQRLWGIPIPVIRCEKCNAVLLEKEVIRYTAEIFKKKGSDSWFTDDLREFLPPGFECPGCHTNEFTKQFDILDVWFESGASFLAVVSANETLAFPADLYLEGSDQHRGWFQVSLIPSVAKESVSPFKSILTHGFVVDGDGRKMSKSMGNVVSPQEVIKRYGADILRLWVAYSDYSEDIKLSEQILTQLVDIYRKIRNTIRFILGNLCDFNPHKDSVKEEHMPQMDRFMGIRAREVFKDIVEEYENFSFYKVCQKLFSFCNQELSSFYLDVLKDRLYTYAPSSLPRRSAQTVLYFIVEELIKLSAPILSFTAEEAFASLSGTTIAERSVFLEEIDRDLFSKNGDAARLVESWEKIKGLREEVLKEIEVKREQGVVGSSLEAEVSLTFPEEEYAFFSGYQAIFMEVCIVSKVNVSCGRRQIEVTKSNTLKCPRCWNFRDDVGQDQAYPEVCVRCAEALRQINYAE
ncbi:MAG: isoleucine--tRNA ligase [Candidatus Omnitrophica bacterium]|nr:isoleucine--tRNA ligase [Candidatus Omnitrophota bacterium]